MFSVLMSVYYQENPAFLQQSLLSIYDQQSLKPHQIVVVQDGPLTPELDAVLASWKERLGDVLTLVPLRKNVGLGAALNEGLKHCTNELVARMDTDDVSLPERFAQQVRFMKDNPEIAASSGALEEFDADLSKSYGRRILPLTHDHLVRFAKKRSPLNHIPSIFRKSIIDKVGGYPPLRNAQDYALWSVLLVKGYRIANQPEVMAHIRAGCGLFERRGLNYFKNERKLLLFQKQIEFLTKFEYIFNFCLKFVVRLSPKFLKKTMYKLARNK